jgi:hypothetical protein
MRKFYPLLLLLLFNYTTWSQVRSWNGGSGNWNDKTKWSPVGTPEETDIIDFSTASGTISNVPNASFRGIVLAGTDIVLNGAAGNPPKIIFNNNGVDIAIRLNDDASLTLSNITLELAQNNTALIAGNLVLASNAAFLINDNGTTHTTVTGLIRNNGGSIISSPSRLAFNDGSVYEHAMDEGTIPAATWSRSSNCNIEGVVSHPPQGINQEFGNFMWNCLNQAAGNLTGETFPGHINGNLIVNNVGNSADATHYLLLPGETTIEGNLVINSGILLTRGASTFIDIHGDFIMTGGTIKAIATIADVVLTIRFSGNHRQSFSKFAGSVESVNGSNKKADVVFMIPENSAVDFGESVLDGNASFVLSKGARIFTAHKEGLATTGLTGTIQVKGTRYFSSDADYVYTGGSHQITGTGLPLIVRKLIIDNSAGVGTEAGVTLTKPVAISQELILQNGFIHSEKNSVITILDGANAASINNAFIEGPVRKAGRSSFVFPTGWSGTNGGLIPIAISSMNSAAVIQAEYKRAPATDKGITINAPLQHISYCDYWELFPVTGNPKAIVTMYRNSHSNCNPVSVVQDFATVRVARSNGREWSPVGDADGSMNAGVGYVNSDSTGIFLNKSEIYYALGNISISRDPLPVLYDSVVAYPNNNGIVIEWSNLTERDIASYFVERSVNGKDFSVISQHLPKSNRDDKASYASFDANPAPGTSYYRVKTIEKNTKIIFSKILRVETDRIERRFGLYPNPLKEGNRILNITGVEAGRFHIDIVNISGIIIHRKDMLSQGYYATQLFELTSNIKPGMYNLILKGDSYQKSKMFIVQ